MYTVCNDTLDIHKEKKKITIVKGKQLQAAYVPMTTTTITIKKFNPWMWLQEEKLPLAEQRHSLIGVKDCKTDTS